MRRLLTTLAVVAMFFAPACSRNSSGPSAAATAPSAQPPQRIYTALILATNGKRTMEVPEELSEYASRMRRVFGYRNFQLIGQSMKTMDDNASNRWLIPGQDFSLQLASREKQKEFYLLEIELYKRKRLLVDTSCKLGLGSPLFIRAPMSRQGQLIVMLQVR